MQIRSNMQDSLSNLCDNHMVINPIKTKSMTIPTRQKYQLSPLPLDLVLNGAKIYQVSEHRLLGLTIDNKHRWDSHINNVCKTVSRRGFLLSKLRYIVDIETRKLFFNARIKPHIDYASVVYNKGLFMYRILSNEAPEYIFNLYTHTPSCYSSSRNYHLSLPRPRIDVFKTSISFSGAYLWNNLPLTVRSCQSLSSFKRKLRAHLEVVT